MSESIPPTQKTCNRCHQTKDIKEFYVAKSCKDGHLCYCKGCRRKQCYQCKGCRQKRPKEDLIYVGIRSSYCVVCWEAIKGKKKCIGCRVFKDIQEFSEDKSRTDGHEYYCKDCRRGHQIDKYAKEIIEKGTKQCLDCKITKNLSEFPRDNRARDGVGLFCIMCCSGQKVVGKPKKDISREYTEFVMSGSKERQLRSRYGISKDEYREMYEQQRGACAICGRPEQKSRKKVLCVDHNHKTGKVRALLCGLCNSALGAFEENIEYLSKAIEYITKYE